jgi:heme oxygenase
MAEMTMEGKELPLSQRMVRRTKNVHDKSDRLVNLKLAMVLTSKDLYAEAISLFWPIYRELESLLEENKEHEQLKMLLPLLETLRRAPMFEEDMKSMLGGNEELAVELQNRRCRTDENGKHMYEPPELQAYIDNLHQLSKENPIALVAYIYAMYGAIMAGGSMIQRTVKRAFSLKSDKGVEMFDVELQGTGYSNIKAFRNEMKRILDEDMKLTPEQEEAVMKEAPMVFVRNNALVATVKDTPVFASVMTNCYRYLIILPSIVVGVVAILAYYKRSSISS